MSIHTDKIGLGSIIGSKVIAEKRDYISGGTLTFAEGDIIELEIPQSDLYQLGEEIKLTIYSPKGIYVFETMIVAKANGKLLIIHPPEHQKKFGEQRDHPRVSIRQPGILQRVYPAKNIQLQPLDKPLQIELDNISLSGVGFKLPNSYTLRERSCADLELSIGVQMSCQIEVVRIQLLDEQIFYGAKFIQIPENKANALRAFILRAQLESRVSGTFTIVDPQ